MPHRRSTDVRRLNFSLPTVVAIVGGSVSIVVVQYVNMFSVKSDVRDILTRMEASVRITELQTEAHKASITAINNDINEMKRRLELVQLQYAQLRETMLSNSKR